MGKVGLKFAVVLIKKRWPLDERGRGREMEGDREGNKERKREGERKGSLLILERESLSGGKVANTDGG